METLSGEKKGFENMSYGGCLIGGSMIDIKNININSEVTYLDPFI